MRHLDNAVGLDLTSHEAGLGHPFRATGWWVRGTSLADCVSSTLADVCYEYLPLTNSISSQFCLYLCHCRLMPRGERRQELFGLALLLPVQTPHAYHAIQLALTLHRFSLPDKNNAVRAVNLLTLPTLKFTCWNCLLLRSLCRNV